MPQTMLAFLALMMITISSLNQYQAQMRSYDNMVRSEYEIMANAVTIEQLEIIDQGTVWDDLDALNGDSTAVNYLIGSTTLPLTIKTVVQYVDINGAPSGTPTSYKEVALTAISAKFSIPLVTHTRIFAQ